MVLAIGLIVLATVSGALVSYAWDDDAGIIVRLAYGAATGLAALAAFGYLGAQLAGVTAGTVLGAFVLALPLLALRDRRLRSRVAGDSSAFRRELQAVREGNGAALAAALYSVVAIVFLVVVFERVIVLRDGGIFTGFVNNLGDLPFHMQVTAGFVYGQNYPPEHPVYAGTGLAYPYLPDFLAALLVGVGASVRDAFFIQNLTLGVSLVALLYRFTWVLARDRLAAYLAPILLLFSGGLGWTMLIEDAQKGERGLLAAFGSLTHDYSITSDGPYRFGNALTTLLVTQRSLLSGLPLALIVFVLLWRLVRRDPPLRSARDGTWRFIVANRVALAAGVITGLLPLIHSHSFAVVLGTAFLVGLAFRQWRDGRWQAWALYVTVALVLGLPQVWWGTRDSVANGAGFIGVQLGWDLGDQNPVWFWFLNTGLFIPLAIGGGWWLWREGSRGRAVVLFCATFVAWFIVPNVLRLAPWVWDNIRVLLYAFVGAVPLVAFALARLLRGPRPWRIAGALALATLVAAGGIDIWRAVSRQTEYREFDRDGIAIADAIRADTAARSLILHAATYNSPVFLTGRQSLLGYTGQVWSHGLPYAEREAAIKTIYAGDANADALLRQYEVNYLLVTPLERGLLDVNDEFMAKFPLVAEVGAYKLYEIAKP